MAKKRADVLKAQTKSSNQPRVDNDPKSDQLPEERPPNNPKPIRSITLSLLGGYFISLFVLLFSGVTVGACIAFITLTTAIVVTLVLLMRL